MTTRLAVLFAIFSVFGIRVLAENHDNISDERIEELVAQLVSPNKAPKVSGEGGIGPEADYPPDFDEKAQLRVHQARRELNQLGVRAFPFLFDYLGDNRYCMTVDDGPAETNHSVGETCAGIIRCRLEPYNSFGFTKGDDDEDPRTRARRPCYTDHFLGNRDAAKQWWAAHRRKSLVGIQLEVLEWVIAEESRNKREYSAAERDYLNKILADLRATKRPLAASVPWSK